MEEKDETVKKLREELAKLTAPTKKDQALAAYEVALKELLDLDETVKAKQKAHAEALDTLQRVLAGKD